MLSTPRDSELSTFKALIVTPPSGSVLSTSALHKHRARRELPGCEAGHRGLLRCREAWISVGGNGESWEGCELGQGAQVWLSAPASVLQRVDSLTSAARQCLPTHPEPALSLSSTPAQAVRGAWGQPRGARTPELALEGLRTPWAEVEQEAAAWPTPGRALGGLWEAGFALHLACVSSQPRDLFPHRGDNGCLPRCCPAHLPRAPHSLCSVHQNQNPAAHSCPHLCRGKEPGEQRAQLASWGSPTHGRSTLEAISPSPQMPAADDSCTVWGSDPPSPGSGTGLDMSFPSRPHTLTGVARLPEEFYPLWVPRMKSKATASPKPSVLCWALPASPQPGLQQSHRHFSGEAGGAGWRSCRCGSSAARESPAFWRPSASQGPTSRGGRSVAALAVPECG